MVAVDKTSQQGDENVYTYRSKPKTASSRPKYRLEYLENEGKVVHGNMMHDRRVVRGNTYASRILPLSGKLEPIEVQCQQEIKRRELAKVLARKQKYGRMSPPPVNRRQHIEVQTELYLEAITDRVEETDTKTQTDVMLDRPPTPLFTPAKRGKDVETQIYQEDLFNFTLDVKPVLEVMVGKTLEQSLIEVLEEEELTNLRQQQREFEEKRNAELVEMQRLEEQKRRHADEKKRRIQQQRKALQMERETADKIAAIAFASSYLLDLVPNVASCMRKNGYFCDPVERDIEQGFLPFIVKASVIEMENVIVVRTILDCIIREVCLARLDDFTVPDDGYVPPPPVPDFDLDDFDDETIHKNKPKFIFLEPDLQCAVLLPVGEEEYTYDGSC